MPSLRRHEDPSRPRLREKDLGVRAEKSHHGKRCAFAWDFHARAYDSGSKAPPRRTTITGVHDREPSIQGRRVGEWLGKHRPAYRRARHREGPPNRGCVDLSWTGMDGDAIRDRLSRQDAKL